MLVFVLAPLTTLQPNTRYCGGETKLCSLPAKSPHFQVILLLLCECIPLIVGWEWKQKFCFGNLAKCSFGSQQSLWDWKDEASPESLVLCWTPQVSASSPCGNLPLFCTLTTWKTQRAASNSCNIPRCDLFPLLEWWNGGWERAQRFRG